MSTTPVPKSQFDSITRRFVLALALVPIVPASSMIGTAVAENLVTPASGSFDSIWWFHIFFTVLWMTGFILVWRTAVIWTLGKSALTTLVSFIPFVQIVINQPLWKTSGCLNFSDLTLRAGQHYSSCGLWTWLVVWVWWGLERKLVERKESRRSDIHRRSPWLARLGASMGLFPIIVGIFVIVMVYLETVLNLAGAASQVFWEFLFCAIVVLIAWCMIWRKVVCWSDGVLAATCGMWLLLIGAPISLSYFTLGGKVTALWDVVITCLPIIGWGAWMAWTMWYWPMRIEPRSAESQIPACIKCGYSLQGLKATRCPECGDEPTIDELWASCAGAP